MFNILFFLHCANWACIAFSENAESLEHHIVARDADSDSEGVEDGQSLTESLPLFRNDLSNSTIITFCVNPNITVVDECIENIDSKVVEKCIPGLSNMLNTVEDAPNAPIMTKTGESEQCLRQAFAACSYDERFRIKTKIKKVVGLDLDIAFQDNFEMDCCDENMMRDVIDNVKDCFKKPKDMDLSYLSSCKSNISTQILNITRMCVEDHTVFTCLLQNHPLFQKTIRELLDLIREEAYAILQEVGPEKYNHSRLCIKWLDYNRLQSCEPDFFDYVLCLKNGTVDQDLFKKVQTCFEEALNVCPPSTALMMMKILAGSVEGESGAGQPDDDAKISPHSRDINAEGSTSAPAVTTSEPCNSKAIEDWANVLKKCFKSKTEDVSNTNSLLLILHKCVKGTRPEECQFHVFSQFREAIDRINEIIDDIPCDKASKPDKCKNCVTQVDNNNMKDCIYKMFLYSISMRTSHHTKESLATQLGKVKLCFETSMKNCPFGMVLSILKIYAAVLKIEINNYKPPEIVTQVTIPGGLYWCETSIYTDENLPHTTEIITHIPRTTAVDLRIRPSTKRSTVYDITPRRWRRTFPPVQPSPITYTAWEDEIINTFPSYTTRTVTPNLPKKIHTITHPGHPTEVETIQPKPKEGLIDIFTRSTTARYTNILTSQIYIGEEATEKTNVISMKPERSRDIFNDVLTPTTTKRARVTPIRHVRSEMPEAITTDVEKVPPIFIVTEWLTPSTTEVNEYIKPKKPWIKTKRPPVIWVEYITAPDVDYTESKPTTKGYESITEKFTITKTYEIYCLHPTTIKYHVIDKKTKAEIGYSEFTTGTEFITPRIPQARIDMRTPTTSETVIFGITDYTFSTEISTPTTVVYAATPEWNPTIETFTPTSVIRRNATVPIYIVVIEFPRPVTKTIPIPPDTTWYSDVVTPSTISVYNITFPTQTVTEEKRQTTLKIFVNEHPEISKELTLPTAPTHIITIAPPYDISFTETLPTFSTERTKFTFGTFTLMSELSTPSTEFSEYAPSFPTISDHVTRTTKKCIIRHVTSRVVPATQTPPATNFRTFPPEVPEIAENLTRTTVARRTIPVIKVVEFFTRHYTTEGFFKLEPETSEKEQSSTEVQTSESVYIPTDWIKENIRTKSTTEHETLHPGTKRRTKRLPMPETSPEWFTLPETSWSELITPTSYTREEFGIPSAPISKTKLPPKIATIIILPKQRVEYTASTPKPQTHVPISPGYHCVYKSTTPRSPVTYCKNTPRTREICSKEKLERWIEKIRSCVTEKLKEQRININMIVENPNSTSKKKTEQAAILCIKEIGDTSCRNNSFNLFRKVVEKDVQVVNGDEEEYAPSTDAPDQCKREGLRNFIKTTIKCIVEKISELENEEITIYKIMKISLGCLKKNKLSCVISDFPSLMKVINTYRITIERFKEDNCISQLNSKEFKNCMHKFSALIPTLRDLEDRKSPLMIVQNCIKTALSECSAETSKCLTKFILRLSPGEGEGEDVENTPDWSPPTTISSIRIADDNINICVNVFRTAPDQFATEPTFPDDCLEIDGSYYMVKSCRSQQVTKWVKRVNKCVDKKVTKLGLRNPEFLGVNRVLNIMESCVTQKSTIACRPKNQDHFKKLLTSILNTVRQSIMCTKQKSLKLKLEVESISRCFPVLHNYMVLSTYDFLKSVNHEKSMQCLQRSLNGVSKPVIKKMVDLLSSTLTADTGRKGRYETCNPDDATQQPFGRDLDVCGPGGTLVLRKKRDVDDEDNKYDYVDNNQADYPQEAEVKDENKDDEEYEDENDENEVLHLTSLSNEAVSNNKRDSEYCTSAEFQTYSDKIIDCEEKKLRWKFKRTRNKCLFGNLKESWIAMIGCLFDNDDLELTCKISSRDQLTEFLEYSTNILNVNRQENNNLCLYEDFCYKRDSPSLESCSDTIFQLIQLEKQPLSDPLPILNSFKEVLACLSSKWPDCPLQIPMMSLPFIYIPLGFSSIIMDNVNFTSCGAEEMTMYFDPPQCLENENADRVQSLEQDLSDCMECLSNKKVICLFNGISEMFQVVKPGLSSIRQCLKNMVNIPDNCIVEITETVKEMCLPHYYSCSESVQDGDIPDSIENCWKFYQCVNEVPKYCPSEFIQFVPDVYYKILGLSSIFKKL